MKKTAFDYQFSTQKTVKNIVFLAKIIALVKLLQLAILDWPLKIVWSKMVASSGPLDLMSAAVITEYLVAFPLNNTRMVLVSFLNLPGPFCCSGTAWSATAAASTRRLSINGRWRPRRPVMVAADFYSLLQAVICAVSSKDSLLPAMAVELSAT